MKNKGFTLIEFMIVVAIIVIICSTTISVFIGDSGNDWKNKQSVDRCLNGGELPLVDCQINADYLYPIKQTNEASPSVMPH